MRSQTPDLEIGAATAEFPHVPVERTTDHLSAPHQRTLGVESGCWPEGSVGDVGEVDLK